MTRNRKSEPFYGYIIVLAGFLIMAITGGTHYSFGVFFKPLLSEFGWTRAMTSSVFSVYMLLRAFLHIGAGRLNDKFGPRVVMSGCGFFLGLGYLLMSQISALWQVYLFYSVAIAIGMSGDYIALASTVARWFVKRRGIMIGILLSGIGIGTIIMPPLATRLITTYGWRTSYIIIGIVALVVIISAAQFLRRDPSQIGQSPYGENEIEGKSYSQAMGISLRGAIHARQFWMLSIIWFCSGFFSQTIMVHIVPHVTDLRISAAMAANTLAIIGGLSVVGRILMGSAADRIGSKLALIVCFVLSSTSLFWLLAAKETWMLYLFAGVFGFAYGGKTPLIALIVAELFGLSSHGVILGTVLFITALGSAIGPVVAGYIFDITGSYNLAFLICAVISVAGLILVLLLKPVKRKGATNGPGGST